MITSLEIRNFQSLHHVNVALEGFTVIVGPSSSGKSAFTRAVKLLTSNARGDSFITHNELLCTVKAVTDKGIVTIKRGRKTTDNEYTITPADPNVQQQSFTKLNATVPDAVSEFLGIAAKDPINYAGQHDAPYLLDTTGGEVARVLGALTNVSIIFEAARESNRRKLAQAGVLKTRAADLAIIKTKAEKYRALKDQRVALEDAEKNLARAQEIRDRINTLTHASETLEVADAHLARLEALHDINIPDVEPILAAAARLQLFRTTIKTISSEAAAHRAADAVAVAEAGAIELLEQQYTNRLIEAGTCPTCKQTTKNLEHHHAS